MFLYKEEADLVQDREDLLSVLRMRYGDIPPRIIENIYAIDELDALERLILVAANAPNLDIFTEELNEGSHSFKLVGDRFDPMGAMFEGSNLHGKKK